MRHRARNAEYGVQQIRLGYSKSKTLIYDTYYWTGDAHKTTFEEEVFRGRFESIRLMIAT
jgi:hypothetical protein